MLYEVEFLDSLQECEIGRWEGEAFRHMFGSYPPIRENTGGARWNPPGVAAVYTSLTMETALAEAEYRINLEPLRPRSRRTVYRIRIVLGKVVKLSRKELNHLGATDSVLDGMDLVVCQKIGGAANFMEYDGLIVPSARHIGENLVIYPANRSKDCVFDVLEEHPILT